MNAYCELYKKKNHTDTYQHFSKTHNLKQHYIQLNTKKKNRRNQCNVVLYLSIENYE